MKAILLGLGMILVIIAALALPFATVVGIYEWAVVDVEFKLALWKAVKVWATMMLCVVPGGAIILSSK